MFLIVVDNVSPRDSFSHSHKCVTGLEIALSFGLCFFFSSQHRWPPTQWSKENDRRTVNLVTGCREKDLHMEDFLYSAGALINSLFIKRLLDCKGSYSKAL